MVTLITGGPRERVQRHPLLKGFRELPSPLISIPFNKDIAEHATRRGTLLFRLLDYSIEELFSIHFSSFLRKTLELTGAAI